MWHLVLLDHIALLSDHVVLYVVIAVQGDSQPPTCGICICHMPNMSLHIHIMFNYVVIVLHNE